MLSIVINIRQSENKQFSLVGKILCFNLLYYVKLNFHYYRIIMFDIIMSIYIMNTRVTMCSEITSRVFTVIAQLRQPMNQNMLIWLAGNQDESNGPPCCLGQKPQMSPLLPQSDYAISFKSLKARTLVESSYLAKPKVLRQFLNYWCLN